MLRRMTNEIRRLEIRDPRALRAMAHPVRLRLAEELFALGSATATELAERIGESAANCSWHLRQLARYGFVEEAGGGTGRQRPWRLVARVNSWGAPGEDAELAAVGDAAAELLLATEYAALHNWYATRQDEPEEWREASGSTQAWMMLTAEELSEVVRELVAVATRYSDRVDPAKRPPGARLVRMVAWAVPGVNDHLTGGAVAGPAMSGYRENPADDREFPAGDREFPAGDRDSAARDGDA